ncbi:NEL-type E3 ubiquitin ligase domain-containing protein [Pseudomonas sp. PB3P13]
MYGHPARPNRFAVSRSLHGPLLESTVPGWLTAATAQRRQQLKDTPAPLPDFYQHATPMQRKALNDSAVASFAAQTRLDKAMAGLQDIDTFAEPLLSKALKDQLNAQLDVNKTFLLLRKSVELGVLGIDVSSFEVLKLPLLQAALHNFEASESEDGAFHRSSGFLLETSTPGTFKAADTSVTVEQFIRLCRSLDIGAQYQDYLKRYLEPDDAVAEQVLREKFTTAQKTALRAAAEMALLTKDIEPRDYSMILSVIDGELQPRQGEKQVWFRDLSLMKHRMTGCVVFTICEKYRYSDELILYIPNDPYHPLKRLTFSEMRALFKQRFTDRDGHASGDPAPTAYQRFFSQFVAYADRPDYFNQFTVDVNSAFSQNLTPYASLLNELLKGISPFGLFTSIKELPPARPSPKGPNNDPYIGATSITQKGGGLWLDNVDLWTYLFEQHRDKVIADARSHAVPTADVDARVRSEKFSRLLNIGMLVLTGVSMFVPVLGEVMMVVMAGQLLEETFEGAIEWSEGDRKAAKAHLVDVAENLALLAVMAAAGKGFAKLTAVEAVPLIERLDPVTVADGQPRLWRPELKGYESPVNLDGATGPNAHGQYQLDGKTYIRQSGKVYETTRDASVQRWRIKHPTNPRAYQPMLNHNGAGAWRHTLERPLTWDRLTLLRRMGPVTDVLTDQQLLEAADISGVSDNVLRKMHLDNQPPPAELRDTLRLFEVQRDLAAVIQQVATGESIDARYLSTLPLMSELPRWPAGRVLEVFEDPALTGPSVKYGTERLVKRGRRRPVIRISRAAVMKGELPGRILAALDESEINSLLGGEPARVREGRVAEFRKQLADFVQVRQAQVFEHLYAGMTTPNADVATLQRLHPGLSEPAAQAVLTEASGEQLSRLQTTGRVPLALQEQARWHVQQGRLSRAYAGLHMENMASADSKRLALHALEKLPGWSDQLRLEIRDGHIGGTLLDGIGSESAMAHKYLVKKGPFYQAYNERGETLNSLPRYGDNFYQSLMHALPDDARQALGLPHTHQNPALRNAIIDAAVKHRADLAPMLEQRRPSSSPIKPPARLRDARVGYYASGDGPGMDVSLTSRVQVVYPALTDQQANGYLLKLRRAGYSDAQIYGHLQERLREWETLEATLDEWVRPIPQGVAHPAFGIRAAAQNIKASWRGAPLADEDPRFARLEISLVDPLPTITAEFPHVRELVLMASGPEALLPRFPNVEKLNLIARAAETPAIFEVLRSLPRLTNLTMAARLTPALITRLSTLTSLEELSLLSIAHVDTGSVMDFSAFTRLRRLEVVEPQMTHWPAGVLDLPRLERLNLRRTAIGALPEDIFTGHDRLLSGLSLDWSTFPREVFKPVYEFVSRQPRHLIDLAEMVGDYCKGELRRLSSLGSDVLYNRFVEHWPDPQARFDAIEALSSQHAALERQMSAWELTVEPSQSTSLAAASLRACWRNGLYLRYGSTGRAANLDLLYGHMTASTVLDLGFLQQNTLPRLPVEAFSHVQTLRLTWLRAPDEQVGEFVRGFRGLRTLDLSNSSLTALPLTAGDLPALQHLNLRGSQLTRLDVGGLDRLESLDLRGTPLEAWPTGAENLANLTWLDLRATAMTTLPPTMLASDSVLLSVNLTGAALTEPAQVAFNTALQRVEQAKGLTKGTLSRFALDEVPEQFPPGESGASISQHLLPLLPPEPVGSALSLEQRLQRLCPALEPDEARPLIEEMRASGASEPALHERINGWNRTHEALTRRLNDWLYIRETRGRDWIISAQNRRLAGLRIMQCWREGLFIEGSAEAELNLNGLQVGDLPELPTPFPHVDTLNLTGVRLSQQGSNGFLRAFNQLHALILNANALLTVPEAVESMTQLQWLEMSSTGLLAPDALYQSATRLQHLQWLDVGHNNLQVFDVGRFPGLQTLDLRNNRLTEWPDNALQVPSLQTLNLSGNDITSVPPEALNGSHDLLMAGTDLSDNFHLSQDSVERLRTYAQSGGRNGALGFSPDDLEAMIEDEDDEFSSAEAVESDEELPDAPALPEERAPWFTAIEEDALAEHQALWDDLEAEPGHEAFFHLLLRLQDTEEFNLARADLTRRVWEVLKAAASDAELRETLFAASNSHGTCADGRILTFSGLEIWVYAHNALLDIDRANLVEKGAALLKLSRQLFRLDRVEELAKKSPLYRHDPAEARLEYRIGLQEALDLPAQPKNMRYGRPITGDTWASALRQVREAEQSRQFYEELLDRPYWIAYLEEKYPEAFRTLEQSATEKKGRVEDAHSDFASSAYLDALDAVEVELGLERSEKLIELSRQETGETQPAAPDEPQPGTSAGLRG